MSDNRHPIPTTPLYMQMRSGHQRRLGHRLRGYLTDGGTLVRTCCGPDRGKS